MPLDIITTPDGVTRYLGCLLPEVFPTEAPKFADAFGSEMLTLDQVRAMLVGKSSMWGRRQRFAGPKYISDQHSTSACNGHSTAHILSRIRELRGEPYVMLSGADAYSQMNGGRDQGSTLADGMKVCESGIATIDAVPWNQIYSWQISAAAKAERLRFKGFRSYAVDEEEELATALMLGRCAVVAVHATNSFNSEDGDGVNRGVNGPGNHSTGIQDIRLQADGTLNYDQPNSWNTGWCSSGYTWLTWARHFRESVKFHRFWVLVSSTDDPSDNSAPPVAVP